MSKTSINEASVCRITKSSESKLLPRSAPEYNESYETFFKYTGVSSIRTKKISALPTVTLQVIRTNKQDNIR